MFVLHDHTRLRGHTIYLTKRSQYRSDIALPMHKNGRLLDLSLYYQADGCLTPRYREASKLHDSGLDFSKCFESWLASKLLSDAQIMKQVNLIMTSLSFDCHMVLWWRIIGPYPILRLPVGEIWPQLQRFKCFNIRSQIILVPEWNSEKQNAGVSRNL